MIQQVSVPIHAKFDASNFAIGTLAARVFRGRPRWPLPPVFRPVGLKLVPLQVIFRAAPQSAYEPDEAPQAARPPTRSDP